MRALIGSLVCLLVCVGLTLGADDAKKKAGKAQQGTIKKVDAATGTLTVAIKVKKETADKEFKIDDATKITVLAGEDKKELTGKDGLKNEQFKEGATVAVMCDEGGKVLVVRIGQAKKKDKQ